MTTRARLPANQAPARHWVRGDSTECGAFLSLLPMLAEERVHPPGGDGPVLTVR